MDIEPPQLRRALASVEHFVSCHPDSSLHKYGRILYIYRARGGLGARYGGWLAVYIRAEAWLRHRRCCCAPR
jgi:hypothetical protein